MPTPPPAPEEKGKTLEELLEQHDYKIKDFWFHNPNPLTHQFIDLAHERDAIHSKHYASLERELVSGLKKILNDLENGYVPYTGAVTVPDTMGDFVRGLLAKQPTPSPTGKV